MTADDVGVSELWDEVVGQDHVVAQLRAAVRAPVHAYLLVGPEGSGKLAATTAFAADLLSDGLDELAAQRARRLVALGQHPSLLHFEPAGPQFTAELAAEVAHSASRTPPEGSRQVLVLHGLDRSSQGTFERMLKAIEEPAPGTFFVVPITTVPVEMATIASRCVRLDVGPVPEGLVEQRLLDEGADPESARLAASRSGGSLRRARLLVDDPDVARRAELWRGVPGSMDGTGAAAARVAEELLASVEAVLEPLAVRHAEELDAFHAAYEAVGETAPKGRTKQLTDRHKRELRKVRLDELRAGLAGLVETYRRRVTGGDATGEDFLAVAQLVQELCDALEFNPNESLQLRALLLTLPPLR